MDSNFLKDGLRFECTQCSHCCRHEPGFVFLSAEDVQRLVEGLGIDLAEFTEKYLREVHVGPFRRVSLKEKENFDCIFWEEKGCCVYKHRPLQCRTYPFWPSCVASPEAWEKTLQECPGAGHGRLYTEQEILDIIDLRKKEPFISLS